MKILIPTLALILVICGCSKQQQHILSPKNATLILLCSSILETNDGVHVKYKVDEVIKGQLDPEFIDDSNILKGVDGPPLIENARVPEKSFLFAEPQESSADIFQHGCIIMHVHDESLLEHKNDIIFIQSHYENFMNKLKPENTKQNQELEPTSLDAD